MCFITMPLYTGIPDTTDTTRYQTTNYEIIIITERSAGVNNNNTIILLHL